MMSCVCMMSCVWFMFSHSHSHLMFTPHSGGSTYAAHQPPGWGGIYSTPTTRLVDAVCGVWLGSFCFGFIYIHVHIHIHIHIHTWCAHRTHIIPLNYWGLWWLWVVCCGVLGCFVACSHTFMRRFTAHISHACAMHILGCRCCCYYILGLSRCTSVQAVCSTPRRRPRQHGPALRVMNNDCARRYGAAADRPDRPLTPASLASPSDPPLTCAVPCATGCCPVKSARGMLPPRVHRVAAAQQVSAFKGSIRTQCPAVLAPEQHTHHALHRSLHLLLD